MTATEEVEKPSAKKSSLLELKDFWGGRLNEGAKNSCKYSLLSKKFCALPQTT
jgi:hypothetical protein